MPYKISGSTSESMRIIVIKESDWSVESNTIENDLYEITGLDADKKTIVGIRADGESSGYGNIAAVRHYTNEDCTDISDWTDNDQGTGVSSQTTFDGRSCFKFDVGATPGGVARRYKDIGGLGDQVTVELTVNHDAIGVSTNGDSFHIAINHADVKLNVLFATDGLFVYDGATWNEVGTNLVQEDTWQTWIFDCDFSTPASAICDIYLNGELKASDVDCSQTGSFQDGLIMIDQNSATTANLITYLDYINIA